METICFPTLTSELQQDSVIGGLYSASPLVISGSGVLKIPQGKDIVVQQQILISSIPLSFLKMFFYKSVWEKPPGSGL